MRVPTPPRTTGRNDDGTYSVSVQLELRVEDWEALKAASAAGSSRASDATALVLAVAEGLIDVDLPGGIGVAHVRVNYLGAAAAKSAS